MIKYLNSKVTDDKDINEHCNEVYASFEFQIMSQLFDKN
jgi:hypothetical protein